jgi:lambda family phage minor tail protein L
MATASIAHELTKLTHRGIVTLFALDATALGAPQVFRFANQVNELGAAIVWQGVTYQPFPIEAEGFEKTVQGPFPRPMLRCSNVLGTLAAAVRQYKGLKGAKLTRKRTLATYLDAVNFAAGNPTADPLAAYPDEVWLVDRTSQRNKVQIEWELANPLDVVNAMLPARTIRPNHCPWLYRGGDCGYTGGAVAKRDDTATTVLAQDDCSKLISGCKKRFGNNLPSGAFPGVGLLRQI